MQQPESKRNAIVTIAGIGMALIVTFMAYLPGLGGPLLLDDFPQLEGLISQGANDAATLFDNYIVSTSGPLGRPVSMATFIGNAVAHGPDIWWWKFDNLMLHLMSGLLVAWLTALLVDALPHRIAVSSWTVGAVVAGLWLLHPLQASTVLYTVQRMTELATLFVLAGLVCYVKGRLVQQNSARHGWAIIVGGFAVFFPLAIYSKESALLLPVYCTVIEWFILQFRGSNSVSRQVKAVHGALAVAYVSAAIYVLINFDEFVLQSYAVRDFTFLERILTQFRVIVIYLDQILLPVQSKMGFFHDDIEVSTGMLSPITTLLSILVVATLIASAFILRKKSPLYAAGIILFFSSHLLESSIFALELVFEHRNYFGSIGILIALAALAMLALEEKNNILRFATAFVLLSFSLLTWQRAITWSSPEDLYDFAYYAHPESPRVNLIFSNAYAAAGEYELSRQYLSQLGSALGPETHKLLLNCRQFRRVSDHDVTGVTNIRGGIVRAHATSSVRSLVDEVASGQCRASPNSLEALLDHLLELRPRSTAETSSLLVSKARLLEAQGKFDSAIATLQSAHELSTGDAIHLYQLANTLINANRPDEARTHLTQAYELEKSVRIQRWEMAIPIYGLVANAYITQNRLEEALDVSEEAILMAPQEAAFYIQKASLLIRMNRISAAKQLLNRLSELELDNMHDHLYSLRQVEQELQYHLTGSTES